MKRKRTYESSELVRAFAKIYHFEDKLLAFEVKSFLEDYLDTELFSEVVSVNLSAGVLSIKINSPLLRNDFRLRKSFYLQKFQEKFGAGISNLQIL